MDESKFRKLIKKQPSLIEKITSMKKQFSNKKLSVSGLLFVKGGMNDLLLTDKKKETDSEIAIEELEIVCESWTLVK